MTTQTKHTPGPWHSGPENQPQSLYWGNIAILEHRSDKERVLVWADVPVTEHEANARLIAAAPDLLEVLIKTRWFLMAKARKDPKERKLVEQIRKAIAMAEG